MVSEEGTVNTVIRKRQSQLAGTAASVSILGAEQKVKSDKNTKIDIVK